MVVLRLHLSSSLNEAVKLSLKRCSSSMKEAYCQSFIILVKKMSEGGYKIRNQEAIHFITFAVTEWVDVFTRKDYRDIVIDSLKFCQTEKGLLLHCWCIMSNHLHLIISAKNKDLSDVLRDFKKYTNKQIITAIQNNQHESRKD